MADTTGFSHITVSTDDDDDVVIQAGIADGAFEESGAEEAGEGPAEAPADEDGSRPGIAGPDAAPEPAAAEEARRAPADDGYRETTLEDIEGAKMSTTQKAVIVVALLGIAAFVAWYLFAR